MDKRSGTDDDFGAAGFAWPYFRKVSEAIERAVRAHHARTGGYVRDLQTLAEELRREGLDAESLRDPWGQRYSFEFDVDGRLYRITVRSSGPNKSFERRDAEGSDDFTLSTTLTDYFADTNVVIDLALAGALHESGYFPENDAELRAPRSSAGRWTSTRCATRGATGSTRTSRQARATPTGTWSSIAQESARPTTLIPVTQILRAVTLRSPGPDRQKGTVDDFTLGTFTNISLRAVRARRDAATGAGRRDPLGRLGRDNRHGQRPDGRGCRERDADGEAQARRPHLHG